MKLVLVFIFLLLIAAVACAQPRIGGHTQENDSRTPWNANLHIAAGSSNGARLGFALFPWRGISTEMSVGYVQLKKISSDLVNNATTSVDGFAISAGLNYYTHPLNDISPTLSAILSFNKSFKTDEETDRSRFIISTAVGADAGLFWRINFFFRAGPSIHFLSKTDKNAIQMFIHFDGGLGVSF
jgi:hypothetical protein